MCRGMDDVVVCPLGKGDAPRDDGAGLLRPDVVRLRHEDLVVKIRGLVNLDNLRGLKQLLLPRFSVTSAQQGEGSGNAN